MPSVDCPQLIAFNWSQSVSQLIYVKSWLLPLYFGILFASVYGIFVVAVGHFCHDIMIISAIYNPYSLHWLFLAMQSFDCLCYEIWIVSMIRNVGCIRYLWFGYLCYIAPVLYLLCRTWVVSTKVIWWLLLCRILANSIDFSHYGILIAFALGTWDICCFSWLPLLYKTWFSDS